MISNTIRTFKFNIHLSHPTKAQILEILELQCLKPINLTKQVASVVLYLFLLWCPQMVHLPYKHLCKDEWWLNAINRQQFCQRSDIILT